MGHSRRTAVLGLAVAAVTVLGGVGVAALRVQRSLVPPRAASPGFDFRAMRVEIEEIRFPAVDGVEIAGWLLGGEPGRNVIVLCHDFGSSKDSMVDLALALDSAGFAVLAFDFRGHGESPGGRSTRGLDEKRDVIGALDYLAAHPHYARSQVGIYGVGMGAHAAVLAAAERRSARVLVLDGLYPDVGFPLSREVYAGWEPGLERLRFVPEMLFLALRGKRTDSERASDVLGGLVGRDMLLLAPDAGHDARLAAEIERMYHTIPQQRDTEGNLVHLPATQSGGLYGENVARHRTAVEVFFSSRLASDSARR